MWSNRVVQGNGLGWVKILLVTLLLVCVFAVNRHAYAADSSDIVLSESFVDGMTLPAYKTLFIKGQAPKGQTLDIKLIKNNFTITMARVTVNSDNNWDVMLNEQAPGGPYQLKVMTKEHSKVVNDIYIGQDDYNTRNPNGAIILSTHLSDDMLLQPGEIIHVSGLAEPGRSLDIKLIKEQKTFTMARVQAGRDGQWHVSLSAQSAGGPFQIDVTDGTHHEVLNGIIIGRADIKKAPLAVEQIIAEKSNINKSATTEIKPKTVPVISEKHEVVPNQIKNEWLQQQFDDSSWPLMNLTSLEQLPKNETLIARKHVNFAIDPHIVSLSIGTSNQIKQIYINGKMLDAIDWQQNPTDIQVPSGMFQSGDNVIALVSEKPWDNTGFIGSSGHFKIDIDNYNLELSNNWSVFYSSYTKGSIN